MEEASCLILKEFFLPWPSNRVLKLGLIEEADPRSQREVGGTHRSSLVVKTKPSSESKDALTQKINELP